MDPARPERLEGPLALGLRATSVDGLGCDAGAGQLGRHPVGAVLGAHEDDRRRGGAGQCGEGVGPVGVCDVMKGVRDTAEVVGVVDDLMAYRVLLVPAHEDVDVTVERRREQQGLTVGRRGIEDPTHGRQESHVRHAVGLVEHDGLHLGQPDRPGLHQVLEAPRAGDDHVRAGPHRLALALVAHPAVHDGDATAPRLQQWGENVGDLQRQLARGHEDQGLGLLRRAVPHRRRHGKRECEGLAGSRRRLCRHVAAGQGVGDGHRLDRQGGGDALGGQDLDQSVGQREVAEGGDGGHIDAQRGGRQGGTPFPWSRTATSGWKSRRSPVMHQASRTRRGPG